MKTIKSVFTCPYHPEEYLIVVVRGGVSYYRCPLCDFKEEVRTHHVCVSEAFGN